MGTTNDATGDEPNAAGEDHRRPAPAPRHGEPPAGLAHSDTPHRRRQDVPWWGVVLTLALAVGAGFALFRGFTETGFAAADAAVLDRLVQRRTDDTTLAAVAITEIGNTAMMSLLALGTAGWLLRSRRFADAVFAVVAWGGAVLWFRGLKILFDRERPPLDTRLVAADNESLPSGHATMAMTVIATLVVLAWANRTLTTRIAMVAVGAAWVLAVGLTRVYLGVHWWSDVLAGWLVGGTWVAACGAVWLFVQRRRALIPA